MGARALTWERGRLARELCCDGVKRLFKGVTLFLPATPDIEAQTLTWERGRLAGELCYDSVKRVFLKA